MTRARYFEIEDLSDARLGAYVGIRDRDHRADAFLGSFLCEGLILVERLLDSDLEVLSVLVTAGKLERLRPRLEGRDLDVLVASQELLNDVVGFNIHRGVIASARRRKSPTIDELLAGSRSLAVLEGVTDHENLGAIFRSALALGIDGVMLDSSSGDPYYRRSVRVSMGATFTLPFSRLTASENVADVLRVGGFSSIALTPDPCAAPLDQFILAEGSRPAVLLGAEGAGLRPETLQRVTHRVRIPVRPGVDSLNVGHAAAIAFHRFGSV